MKKVFLDTNFFIDYIELRDPSTYAMLKGCELYLSVFSLGIWCYVYKHRVPNELFTTIFNTFNITATTEDMAHIATRGPTTDIEDNLQLYSAVEADCEFFLTKDTALLKLGCFGKCKIVSSLV